MTEPIEATLRSGLCDAAMDWAPSESPAIVGHRVLRRIRRRRRRQAAAVAGVIAAGLATVMLVGQVVAAPQVLHQVASPRQTTSIPVRRGSTAPVEIAPNLPCPPACSSVPGPQSVAPTTTVTRVRRQSPHHPGIGPRPSVALPRVTVPTTQLPVTTEPPTTLAVTTVPTTLPLPTTTVTTQPPPQTYTITAADRGKTLDIHAGDEVVVNLLPCPGGAWSAVAVSDPTVLVRQMPPSTILPPGAALASFLAATTGQAQVTAQQRSVCAATPTAAFAVTIIVN
jgi:hypothetical protein